MGKGKGFRQPVPKQPDAHVEKLKLPLISGHSPVSSGWARDDTEIRKEKNSKQKTMEKSCDPAVGSKDFLAGTCMHQLKTKTKTKVNFELIKSLNLLFKAHKKMRRQDEKLRKHLAHVSYGALYLRHKGLKHRCCAD